MFTGSQSFKFSVANIIASATSSTKINSLVGVPSPHNIISLLSLFLASYTFLIIAGITCEDFSSKLS